MSIPFRYRKPRRINGLAPETQRHNGDYVNSAGETAETGRVFNSLAHNPGAASRESYRIHSGEADHWGGDWVAQAFRKHNITIMQCAKPKSQIYLELLPLINARRCALLDHPRAINQLCGLERRTSRSGRDSVDHPVKCHDDLCNALAGALVMAGTARPPMRINPELLARI